jgi:predicted Zn-dependent peptidase
MQPAPEPGPLDGASVLVRRRRTEQAHICLGVRAPSYRHPDRYVIDLLNTVLGEGMSSRLFLNIREKLGLAYDVHSFTQKHRDTGYLGVYLGVDPKKALESVDAVMGELRGLCDRDVEPDELERAKEFTKGRLRLELETTNGVAFWLTYQELLLGEIRTIEDELALVDAVTADDVRRVANEVFGTALQMAVIGPFSRDAGFRAAIGA